jgi:hypothetical protein
MAGLLIHVSYFLQEFVSKSIARWVSASDETQIAVMRLDDSKELISRFNNAVATRTCVSNYQVLCPQTTV